MSSDKILSIILKLLKPLFAVKYTCYLLAINLSWHTFPLLVMKPQGYEPSAPSYLYVSIGNSATLCMTPILSATCGMYQGFVCIIKQIVSSMLHFKSFVWLQTGNPTTNPTTREHKILLF